MSDRLFTRIYHRFVRSGLALIAVLIIGTIGYRIVGGAETSIVDALYMTFITIATIGYGEIIDMTNKPGARIFTMIIAFAGIAITTYIFSTVTAFIVQGEMNLALRRRKMQNRIEKLSGHYIVCGLGWAVSAAMWRMNWPRLAERTSLSIAAWRKSRHMRRDFRMYCIGAVTRAKMRRC